MIYTRQNSKGKWWCNATIFGYDHSFEALTIAEAQLEMVKLIIKHGDVPANYYWADPTYYRKEVKAAKSQIGYRKSRIDNL